MYIDKQNVLGTDQAITVTAPTSDYLDQGADRDLGLIDRMFLLFTVTQTFVAAGAATLQVNLQCDEDPAFGSVKSPIETPAIAKATLVDGYQFFLPLSPDLDERYVRANYTVATGPFTAGKITAQIVKDIQKSRSYADSLTV